MKEWVSVLKHDKIGEAITGSKQQLVEDVKSGYPVRIAVYADGQLDWRHVFDANPIFTGNGQVSAQHVFIASGQDVTDPTILAVLQPLATIAQNYSTTGRVSSVAKQGDTETKTVYNWSLEWFVNKPK